MLNWEGREQKDPPSLALESESGPPYHPQNLGKIFPLIPNGENGQGLFWTGITDEDEEGKYVEI